MPIVSLGNRDKEGKMRQWIVNSSVTNFFFMAIPAFAVNALVQHLFGQVDYQLATITAVILGVFWAGFMKSQQSRVLKEKRHS